MISEVRDMGITQTEENREGLEDAELLLECHHRKNVDKYATRVPYADGQRHRCLHSRKVTEEGLVSIAVWDVHLKRMRRCAW